jgi:hypothetical protein
LENNYLPLQLEIPIEKYVNGTYTIIMNAPNAKFSARFVVVK